MPADFLQTAFLLLSPVSRQLVVSVRIDAPIDPIEVHDADALSDAVILRLEAGYGRIMLAPLVSQALPQTRYYRVVNLLAKTQAPAYVCIHSIPRITNVL